MKKEAEKAPSQGTAKSIVAKMNGILKKMSLSEAVLDREYNILLRRVRTGGRWGVRVDGLKMIDGKPWAGVRLVSTDDAEYREMFG